VYNCNALLLRNHFRPSREQSSTIATKVKKHLLVVKVQEALPDHIHVHLGGEGLAFLTLGREVVVALAHVATKRNGLRWHGPPDVNVG